MVRRYGFEGNNPATVAVAPDLPRVLPNVGADVEDRVDTIELQQMRNVGDARTLRRILRTTSTPVMRRIRRTVLANRCDQVRVREAIRGFACVI